MVKVKVCGITNLDDAVMCANLGADALGFVFYDDSPRNVAVETAKSIIDKIPPFVEPVAVVVDKKPELLLKLHHSGFRVFQVYFLLSEDIVNLMPSARFIQAHRVSKMGQYNSDYTMAVLVDAYDEVNIGGTGKSLALDLAVEVKNSLQKPLILAGGLGPDNVAKAVEAVRPFAVDASSRLESEPGRKDAEKVRNFIINSKRVF